MAAPQRLSITPSQPISSGRMSTRNDLSLPRSPPAALSVNMSEKSSQQLQFLHEALLSKPLPDALDRQFLQYARARRSSEHSAVQSALSLHGIGAWLKSCHMPCTVRQLPVNHMAMSSIGRIFAASVVATVIEGSGASAKQLVALRILCVRRYSLGTRRANRSSD
jgi:hypothetical protein